MAITQLWVDKYRPTTVDQYVFTNEAVKEQVEHWVKEKNFPNLLFFGSSGTGKTTLAKILIRSADINDLDVLYVNGSKEGRKIDWLRETLERFCQTMPFGSFKIVLIDEADFLNKDSVQPAMRNLMEEYSDNVRFILTCNYHHKILTAIKSRCTEIEINSSDMNEFCARVATVLMNENVEFDLDTLDVYVRATYPDLRKCLNLVQPNSVTGRLKASTDSVGSKDYMMDVVKLFRQKKIREARQLLCRETRLDEVEGLFTWLYNNLDLITTNPDGQDEAIVIIRRGCVNHVSCGDYEINLSATITELMGVQQ